MRYEEEIIPIPLFVIRYIIKQGYCKHCDKVVYPEVPETIGATSAFVSSFISLTS
ncbi:MAG: hypothetical protein ACXQT5_03595 [Candidatus Syntropharchaeia archaeon]